MWSSSKTASTVYFSSQLLATFSVSSDGSCFLCMCDIIIKNRILETEAGVSPLPSCSFEDQTDRMKGALPPFTEGLGFSQAHISQMQASCHSRSWSSKQRPHELSLCLSTWSLAFSAHPSPSCCQSANVPVGRKLYICNCSRFRLLHHLHTSNGFPDSSFLQQKPSAQTPPTIQPMFRFGNCLQGRKQPMIPGHMAGALFSMDFRCSSSTSHYSHTSLISSMYFVICLSFLVVGLRVMAVAIYYILPESRFFAQFFFFK